MKKIVYGIILFSLMFVVSACGDKEEEPEIIIKDTDYNIKLIKTVNYNRDTNYLISPYSIEIALNMLKSGAANNTLKEIENLVENRKINDVSGEKVKVSNALFIKDKYKEYVETDFESNLKNNYNSEVLYDEFTTPNVINNWVKDKTDNMIDKILDDMDPDFVLGLANAIAIDVNWKKEFECTNTQNKEFTKKDNKKINVEMMSDSYSSSDFKYFVNDKEKGVILPYDNSLEFVGILPNSDVDTYINSMTKDTFNNIDKTAIAATDKKRLQLYLPRFSYSYNLEDFMKILIKLGITDAFNGKTADFTKMISRDNMTKSEIGNLYVGEAVHKTYIDLNEKGTKAAAVTYFGMYKNSMAIEDEYETVEINFNKPFIYMIRDKENKEILFFGVVYEPNEWKGSTCK